MHTIKDKKLLMLKPSQIRIMPYSPRGDIYRTELKALADSIALNGVIEPIAVRKNRDGFYELIAGERRLRAAAMAGLRRVPCVLHNADTATCALYAVTENLQRSRLDFFDEAVALEGLIKKYGFTHTETALKLGITQAALMDKLQLLNLSPQIRKRITEASLTENYARALLLLPEYQRPEVLDSIIADNLTLKETDDLINNKLNPEIKPAVNIVPPVEETTPMENKPLRKYSIGDVRLFANSLQKLTDTLKSAGIKVSSRKLENDKYIEYKVRIKKDSAKSRDCQQLKIC